MEFCFYCSRFPTPGQAWGCTPGNSRLGAAAYAALAGEASARPRRGGCTPGNSRLWSWSPVGTVQDRPRRQPRRRLNAALAGEVGARPRRGGTPGNSRPGSWSPVGTVQDRPRRQPRRRLNAALVGEVSARPRHGFRGTPAAWNFAFPSLKLHKTGVNCRKSMVPGWKTLAKQAILRYYGKVNGAGGLPRRPPG